MPIASGTRLGVYEIVELIGAGGMGEVYRARDSRLDRDVALKILPSLFAADPERLARFEREARTLASLNHPNIAHIHGLEESDASLALVMELVEGEDLAARLARGPIPLDEALPIARQIVDAVEAAHEHGIIHRDLKPANIKLRDDGAVKVLDFGLAKALDPSGGAASGATNSPTLTARSTQLGMILGTAAYMAPEQARGKTVDRRADIWSFGVVVAEMLTGARAFPGDDTTEVLAKVIEREPDLSRLPAATPPSLRRLLSRCLTKDPKQRLRDIGEARVALDDAQRELAQGVPPAPVAARAPARRSLVPWAIAVTALAIAIAAVATRGPREAPQALARLQIALPPNVELYTAVGAAISVSPDGSMLAFVGVGAGTRQVFLRRFDQLEVTRLPGSETAVACVFSPDGRWLLVGLSDTSLRRVRVSDGLVELITPTTSEYLGGWLSDSDVVFSRDGRLWKSSGGATPATQLTQPLAETPEAVESQAVAVPDANALLFVSGRPETPDRARIEALTLADGKRKVVVERATAPLLTRSGHLLFLRDGVMFATPFDARALQTTGEPSVVLRDMAVVRNRGVSSILSVSETGTLVYGSSNAIQSEIVSLSRSGEERTVLSLPHPAANPRLSLDGRRLLFEEIGGGLWIQDLERSTLARLTDGSTLAAFPLITKDGRSAVFRSPAGLFVQPLESTSRPTQIPGTGASEFPSGHTPDGRELLYTKIAPTSAGDIYAVPLDGGQPRVVLSTPAYEGGAQVSPDGRSIVYVSNELGASEIFLQSYPELGGRVQVSSAGGVQPVWNPQGGEIIYRTGTSFMSVRITATGSGATLTRPVQIASGQYAYGGGLTIPNFGISSDGNRLILIKDRSGASLNVVLNWFEALKAIK